MRLILHDSLTTTTFVEPLRRGWVEHDFDVAFASDLRASDIDAETSALISSPEATLLVDSHTIIPDIAVIDQESSAIAMRTPVRADEIEESSVVLYETSAAGEVLARALLWPFFGVTVSQWVADPDGEAQITIVEGVDALRTPEAGHSLDLGRSWFVMTGMPLVTHVLVAPAEATDDDRGRIVDMLKRSSTEAHARRRELRMELDRVYELPRDVLVGYLSGQRYAFEEGDREALVALLVRGAGGSAYRPLTRLPLADEAE